MSIYHLVDRDHARATLYVDSMQTPKIVVAVKGDNPNSSKIHMLTKTDDLYGWNSFYVETDTQGETSITFKEAIRYKMRAGFKVYACGSTRELTELLAELKPRN